MKTKIQVKGMHCTSCEVLLQDELEDINVVSTFNHKNGTATIEFEPPVTLDQIKKVIETEGYTV